MSGTVTARRARADISFAGIDISTSISKYLISMSYTDNEEDETDDLQISLADREDIWLENWLNDAIDASADAEEGQASSASAVTWNIGDEVIANGSPQYSSHGVGTPGSPVTNYRGKITDLNFKDGVSYPICVGVLGWFSEEQITRTDEASSSLSISKGFKIEAAIIRENWTEEGKKERLELGEFELDEISAQGPPSTISIKSSSLPYSSSIRQTKKSKSWEKYSLRGIGNEIAEKNGMSLLFLSEKNPEYERVEQYKQSDIAFLKKLC
ncbi:MAG: hypothetical protein U0M06_08335, partial [Clostridia bacterium]|nr:hypothetical protein [Clostridia bacterium]